MGRAIGIDLGEVRVGLSISDPMGTVAVALMTLKKERKPSDRIRRLIRLAKQNDVTQFVVGLPLNMDGTEGSAAVKANNFGAQLSERSGLPVAMTDERLTTVQAQRAITDMNTKRKRVKEVVDQISAVLILQSWLDGQAAR